MSSRLAARDRACLMSLRRAGAWDPLTHWPISLNRNPSLQTKSVPGQPFQKKQLEVYHIMCLISIYMDGLIQLERNVTEKRRLGTFIKGSIEQSRVWPSFLKDHNQSSNHRRGAVPRCNFQEDRKQTKLKLGWDERLTSISTASKESM